MLLLSALDGLDELGAAFGVLFLFLALVCLAYMLWPFGGPPWSKP